MSGSHEIADEITQDAFLFLLRNPGSYAPERGPLLNFLLGVTRNLVRRSKRSATDDLSIEDEGIENQFAVPETNDSPLDLAIRRQSAASLQDALLKVPEGYREVIVLCDLQEMSYAEAAATLGIPVGTVRSRLHRGHIALLDVLSRRTVAENSGAKL
ncbi:RNA polymerase sigma factor [Candidatus Korobacter versatilis]|nr:RNA polymerase sigma factor [Candidatus Koribacter versatilis]